jgi:hypothetical protein
MDLQLEITTEGAQRKLAAAGAALDPAQLHEIAGRAAFNLIVAHLRDRDRTPNRLGGDRTHYYSQAADGTHMESDAQEATVTVSHVGFRLRLEGGTVLPVNAGALTIPIHPDAHGRRAAEFPGLFRIRPKSSDSEFLADKPDPSDPDSLRVLYVLRASVTQAADPSVMPADTDLSEAVRAALQEHVDRQISRGAP